MIDSIKKHFALSKARQKQSKSQSKPFNMASVRTMGVIFDAHDQRSRALLLGLLKTLKSYDIKLAVLGFDKQNGKAEQMKVSYIPFSNKDFGVFGAVNAEHLNSFSDKKFDILVDLSYWNNFSQECLSRTSKAEFKIGVNTNDPMFDMRYVMPEDVKENPQAFAELFECLKKIN